MRIEINIPRVEIEFHGDRLVPALRKSSKVVAQDTKTLLTNATGTGRTYGDHVASAPGEVPTSITGDLRRSVRAGRVRKRGSVLSTSIVDADFAALVLEAGADNVGRPRKGQGKPQRKHRAKDKAGDQLKPRPFLSVALEANEATIRREISHALDHAFDLDIKK